MKQPLRLTLLILIATLFADTLSATTIFSRQYNMSCGACHIGVPPTLNATGEQFLRNGMRFSENDATTLQRFLADEEQVIPFGMFAGVGTKNIKADLTTKKGIQTQRNDVQNPIVTGFIAGSLSESFSLFLGTQYVYAQKSPLDETKELRHNRSKAYLQYNYSQDQIARGGIIYPYPETSRNSNLSDVPNIFISPLDRGVMKPLYGAEYAYYTQNGWKFLAAGGVVGDANYENSILAQIEYSALDYKLSIIANSVSDTKSEAEIAKYTPAEIVFAERFSLMVPLEYEFGFGYLNVTGLYEENKRAIKQEYLGVESSLTVPLFESANVRYIYTEDNQEGRGHSFRYAHIVDNRLFFNANYATVEALQGSFETLVFGLNFIY